jgi:hypothetical protein
MEECLMLITFHSKAAADVLMRADDALPLLRAAGKSVVGDALPPLGVFTRDQLPAAIAGLEAAVHAVPKTVPDDEEVDHRQAKVTLRQRAFPLLDMMHKSLDAGADIIWESARSW